MKIKEETGIKKEKEPKGEGLHYLDNDIQVKRYTICILALVF